MPRSPLAAVALLTVAVSLASCGGTSPVGPTGLAETGSSVGPGALGSGAGPVVVPPPLFDAGSPASPGRVVIISIDGLRPDALAQAGAAHILGLADRGSYSWRAKTVLPATTLPSHTSMLTGFAPEAHGISWNEYAPARGRLLVPTLFSAARARGLRTAMVAGKDKFAVFRDTGACDTWVLTTLGDEDVVAQASGIVASIHPDLLFVHLPGVDVAGHTTEWMSPAYLDAVRRADQAVGRLLALLPRDATVILTADHGGHGVGHGADEPTDTTIPWIIAGPAIASGRQLTSTVSTVDTAATAARLLGLELAPGASGRSVSEAFLRR